VPACISEIAEVLLGIMLKPMIERTPSADEERFDTICAT
jgi:hypothetical protein